MNTFVSPLKPIHSNLASNISLYIIIYIYIYIHIYSYASEGNKGNIYQ